MNPNIEFRTTGVSRSFPDGLQPAEADEGAPRVLILAGDQPAFPADISGYAAVLIELDKDCLATLVGEAPSHVFGFARYRLGVAEPSDLVELVKGKAADADALHVAKAALESCGLQVSVCADRIGRIIDRLIRPQFNLAFAAVDSGLATKDAIEACVRSGLGYRKGLMEPVEQGGLEHHYEISIALFEAYGLAQYAPARQAIVAHQRKEAGR